LKTLRMRSDASPSIRPASRLGFVRRCGAVAATLVALAPPAGAQGPGFVSPSGRNRPVVPAGADPTVASFVDPTVQLVRPDRMGFAPRVYIAPFASLTAGPGGRILVGVGSDFQDNVTVDARKGDVLIGDLNPIAHGATLIGPVEIGASASTTALPTANGLPYDAFVSFNAWIEDAVIEPGALVNGLSKVKGVTIPSGMQVLPGQLVQTQADLKDPNKLQPLSLSLEEFEEAVYEVNQNFALGYTSLYYVRRTSVDGIGFDPSNTVNPTNPGSVVPIIGRVQQPFPLFRDRIIGRVVITNNTPTQLNRVLGNNDSIRGDEGHPITIGSFARMGDHSTFHSLDNTSVQVGLNARIGNHCVIHGGMNQVTKGTVTVIGNDFTMGDYSVIYRSTIGDNVTIGAKCYIDSTTIPSGAVIPPGTILSKGVNKGTVQW
jgi:carbonic anhydrase/acetyltransferase-like protein (isoleucine patch superfamily)